VLSQRWPCNAPCRLYGCPENFLDSLTTPTATFPKILWDFVPMGPFERALVSFYRPSIVTFLLSLRVWEILPLLFSSTPLFPTPPLVSPKFTHVPLRIGGSPFGYKERRLIVCAISFQDFQPTWSQSTNFTDRQSDRRTDGLHAIGGPRFALKCIAR